MESDFSRKLEDKTTPAHQITEGNRISCLVPGCECYPSVHFECCYCHKIWVIHCRRGYRPKGLCSRCWEEGRALTSHFLVVATNLGILKLDFPEWYHLFKKGVRGKLDSKAQVLAIKCRRSNKVPCNADVIKLSRWGAFKRRYGSPEKYSCCQEDGLPHCRWQPCGHRQRQKGTPVGNSDGSESNDGQDGQSASQESAQCWEAKPSQWL